MGCAAVDTGPVKRVGLSWHLPFEQASQVDVGGIRCHLQTVQGVEVKQPRLAFFLCFAALTIICPFNLPTMLIAALLKASDLKMRNDIT